LLRAKTRSSLTLADRYLVICCIVLILSHYIFGLGMFLVQGILLMMMVYSNLSSLCLLYKLRLSELAMT